MTYTSLRNEVAKLLDPAARQTPWERAGNIALCLLIILNVVAVIAESVPTLDSRFARGFAWFEILSTAAFTLEYLLRVWTCVEIPSYRHPFWGRLRFIVSPMALLDLVVISAALLPSVTVDLRSLRIVRLIRMLRVLKFARYSQTLRMFATVLEAKRADLAVVLLFLSVLIVLASSLMYLVEHAAQPDKFSSIPAAMWWSVATLTTVGYGDIFPITPVGKLLGAIIALVGIGFFALPAGLLASAFTDELVRRRASPAPRQCPRCGGELDSGPLEDG